MSWIDDVAAGTLDLSQDFGTDLATPGIPDEGDLYDRVTQREIDLAKRIVGGPPRCQYHQNNNQSIANDGGYHTLTGFTEDTDLPDTLGGTLSSGVYTVPSAMQLEISAQLSVSNGSVRVVLAVYKNGAGVWYSHGPDNTAGTDRSVALPVREMACAKNDTISFRAFVNGAGVATVTGDTWFRLKAIG